MLEWLDGKKTYIVLVVGAIFNIGVTAGWWAADSQLWTTIDVILGALLGISIRSALTKITTK